MAITSETKMPNSPAERIPGTELYRATRVIVGLEGVLLSLFNNMTVRFCVFLTRLASR